MEQEKIEILATCFMKLNDCQKEYFQVLLSELVDIHRNSENMKNSSINKERTLPVFELDKGVLV